MRSLSKPIIVCLCGSTRFSEAFRVANLQETLAGKIVLSIGCDFKGDDALGLSCGVKQQLDELHLCKIDLADEVLILNVGGYIGQSTAQELVYAQQRGKRVRWLEEYRQCAYCPNDRELKLCFGCGCLACPDHRRQFVYGNCGEIEECYGCLCR